MKADTSFDAVVIGAGPAGLTAGCYLGRYRRSALVVDGGDSRARWIPQSHNTPGFPTGVSGTEFLARLRTQALRYGITLCPGRADVLRGENGRYQVQVGTQLFDTEFVLLSTGVHDQLPPIPGAEEAIRQGLLRLCPICDAYEVTGKAIGVLGDTDTSHAAREAEFLLHYSERVTLLQLGRPPSASLHERLGPRGIAIRQIQAEHLTIDNGRWSVGPDAPGAFDVLYSALGCAPQHQLATRLGAERDDTGALVVNHHQETTVPGIYAAGDVVRGLNQIVVAAAEAAIAATDIHNRLRRAAAG